MTPIEKLGNVNNRKRWSQKIAFGFFTSLSYLVVLILFVFNGSNPPSYYQHILWPGCKLPVCKTYKIPDSARVLYNAIAKLVVEFIYIHNFRSKVAACCSFSVLAVLFNVVVAAAVIVQNRVAYN